MLDPTTANNIANITTIILSFAGLLLIWYWVFSSDARDSRSSRRLGHLGAPWLYFGAMVFFVILTSVFAQAAFGQYCRWFHREMPLDSTFAMMLTTGIMHIGLIGGAWYARRFMLILQTAPGAIPPPKNMPRPEPPIAPAKTIPAGIGVFCIITCVLTVISLLWQGLLARLGVPFESQDLVHMFRDEADPARRALFAFIAVAIVPVSEEMVFRGGLFGYLRTRLPRSIAFGLPALVFALAHTPFNIAAFPLLFALGIILSLAYERTGRIAVPMIAHGLLNFSTIASILLGVEV